VLKVVHRARQTDFILVLHTGAQQGRRARFSQ
jgi:hypothetical protein